MSTRGARVDLIALFVGGVLDYVKSSGEDREVFLCLIETDDSDELCGGQSVPAFGVFLLSATWKLDAFILILFFYIFFKN